MCVGFVVRKPCWGLCYGFNHFPLYTLNLNLRSDILNLYIGMIFTWELRKGEVLFHVDIYKGEVLFHADIYEYGGKVPHIFGSC